MKYTANKRYKSNNLPVYGWVMGICVILIVISIGMPYYVNKNKHENIDRQFYTNTVINSANMISQYQPFWNRYEIILKQRGDTDGNQIISIQERTKFETQFFGDIGLTVDPTTKIITKADQTSPSINALLCHINSFYPDQPWILPICPSL